MAGFVAIGILAIAAVLLIARGDSGTVAGFDSDSFGFLALGLALLVFLGSGLFSGYSGRASAAVKDAVSWVLIAVVLVVGYTYRDDIGRVAQRVAGELAPQFGARMETVSPGEVRIRRHVGGHFIAEVDLNGDAEVRMIVDTGASTVVLTTEDARAAGIDVAKLRYVIPVQTANGVAMAARARLDSLAVGPLKLNNVNALVSQSGALNQSLLGMSFLSRLRSYEFAGEYLTLRS
jgi:aspartyl protease family protein